MNLTTLSEVVSNPYSASALTGAGLYYYMRKKISSFPAIEAIPPILPLSSMDKVLLVAPHQDDETLAAHGLLTQACKQGSTVKIVLVTDGNKFGKTAIRQQELIKALAIAGVKSEQIISLNHIDGDLKSVKKTELKKELRQIINKFEPTIVIAPHSSDKHKDHKITGDVLVSIWKSAKHKAKITNTSSFKLYQYLIHFPPFFPWPRKFTPEQYLLPPAKLWNNQNNWRTLPLSHQEVLGKKKAIEQYSSQSKIPLLKGLMEGLAKQNELYLVSE